MPRRLLRDGILRSKRVNSLSPQSELFYRRLMSVVDDYGRYEAHPSILVSACFPLNTHRVCDADAIQMLTECGATAPPLVRTYTINGSDYLEITDFNQVTRSKPKFPGPCDAGATQLSTNCDASETQMCSETYFRRRISEGEVVSPKSETDATASPKEREREPLPRKHRTEAEVTAMWNAGGFEGPEAFQVWWDGIVRQHPNAKANGQAMRLFIEYIQMQAISRDEFESGYSKHRERWNPGYEPNLFDFLSDKRWRLPAPAMRTNGAGVRKSRVQEQLEELA